MTVYLINERKDKTTPFPDREAAEDERQKLIELGMHPDDLEIQPDNRSETKPDGGEAEPVETAADKLPQEQAPEPEVQEAEVVNAPEKLSEDPIGWLESINNDFVNTIKGTPAISKQGFRFIQSQFGISTESEVVTTFDDPVGVVVWAKAELPDGQTAEAHGEGYLTERDVDDNEFVRYADTRAKNRAISDLTSAGALAVSELSKEQ